MKEIPPMRVQIKRVKKAAVWCGCLFYADFVCDGSYFSLSKEAEQEDGPVCTNISLIFSSRSPMTAFLTK